jgi:hypothetical protein
LERTEPVVISAVVMVVMTSSCPLGPGPNPAHDADRTRPPAASNNDQPLAGPESSAWTRRWVWLAPVRLNRTRRPHDWEPTCTPSSIRPGGVLGIVASRHLAFRLAGISDRRGAASPGLEGQGHRRWLARPPGPSCSGPLSRRAWRTCCRPPSTSTIGSHTIRSVATLEVRSDDRGEGHVPACSSGLRPARPRRRRPI